jgi:hypothetical protein
MRQVGAHRPSGEPHRRGYPDQIMQGGPADRHIMAPSQCRQVNPVAVTSRDHREAGKAAFGGLRL